MVVVITVSIKFEGFSLRFSARGTSLAPVILKRNANGGLILMSRVKAILTSLALFSIAGTAAANSAAKLNSFENRLERLNAYHAQNCNGALIARDCPRVEAGIDKLNAEINRLTSTMQQGISGAAFEREIQLPGTSRLQQQYNEHVAKLQAVKGQIDRMIQALIPASDARLRALQNEASVLHMRLLRLQSRLKGAS